jgi:regulatory protein
MGDAHRLLGHRQRSTAELRTRVCSTRSTPPQAVAEALARLTDDGLLDDEAFARAFVHDKRRGRAAGVAGVSRASSRLGVPAGRDRGGARRRRREN